MKPNREELERAIEVLMKLQFRIVDLSGEELLAIGRGVTSIRAALEREANEPLTWEELAAMIGKPIYIADLVDVSESNWAIVGKAYSKLGLEFITLYDTIEGDVGCQELYGESWLAYRYEPKGEKA